MPETILLIDDDPTLLELLAEHVRTAGYQVLAVNRGDEGVATALEKKVDLVVLDVMMPGMDGWEVCRRLREASTVPILMLTARGEEMDKLRGFHLGVDDYVSKPFSFAEVVARIRAVLARVRGNVSKTQHLTSGDLTIEFDQRKVTVDGKAVELSPTEFRLLETLARQVHRTLPTEQLVIQVWGEAYAGEVEHVKRYIWALRKKIERDPGDPRHILTERGYGYRFE
ncbi:MAG TPA: response regulator transcription factor [Anaerolineales bacterium]|nr:response regulator transcription factor [Anaerolineales bacterium]